MAQGKKLAGILCEGRSPWLVVGLGLNRCVDVEAMGLPQAISLHTLLHSPQAVPTDLELLAAIRAELLWCWQQSQGVQITAQQDFCGGDRSLLSKENKGGRASVWALAIAGRCKYV